MSQAVRVPLKFIGPYPCLALRFPNLATANQRERNATGVSLDFVLDTAANSNTLQQVVATQQNLTVVGRALPGIGSAGIIAQGGDTYLLGDAQLEGLLPTNDEGGDEPFTVMTGLTASVLPVASPASLGLLSLAFLQSFQGGVEFSWGGSRIQSNDERPAPLQPSVTFYGDKSMDNKILTSSYSRDAVAFHYHFNQRCYNACLVRYRITNNRLECASCKISMH